MMSGGRGGGVKNCFLGLRQTALLSAEGKREREENKVREREREGNTVEKIR
jgi:hypothetical protein